MKKSYVLIAISMALVQGCYTAPPYESSSYGSGYSGVSIGIHYSTYPDLVRIPGYPVYYSPGVDSNYFFYDGFYWVFQSDNWYVSSWYNGPWNYVGYYDVPAYLLRVPVRYYRQPPPYFRDWRADAPPHWGDHWGHEWERRRSGWDHWDPRSAPAPAPLPAYQRNYSGDRYPRAVEQQHTIRSEYYRYQPREPVTQQYFKPRAQQDQQRQQRQQDQQDQQDQQRQLDQQRRQEQQRQLELQQRQQEQDRQLDQQRRQEQQRQLELQQQQQQQQQQQEQKRQLEQQRRQDQQRQQEQQRQLEPQQRQQEQQRRQEPQRQQDQQRQKDLQQQRDLERQRSQPEPRGKARDDKAAPQGQVQKDKNTQQEYERRKKEYEERYQNR
ncbi:MULTISPECIES: hypothetical protein [unclassified Thiobacillus]|uniref:hypothetical protein n=1 Tax=unclassified Thiobacillus TaxID=2646513 RepID=UPI000AF9CDF8|nr:MULTISPECIES: hypothetical protein [unclassified Thiobacillus]MBN8778191.1 hypothetical protein [Thiobacillus sp.]